MAFDPVSLSARVTAELNAEYVAKRCFQRSDQIGPTGERLRTMRRVSWIEDDDFLSLRSAMPTDRLRITHAHRPKRWLAVVHGRFGYVLDLYPDERDRLRELGCAVVGEFTIRQDAIEAAAAALTSRPPAGAPAASVADPRLLRDE
jgi:hypothetical protein